MENYGIVLVMAGKEVFVVSENAVGLWAVYRFEFLSDVRASVHIPEGNVEESRPEQNHFWIWRSSRLL